MAAPTAEEPRYRFMIPVERRWKLWIPPVIAVLYVAVVLAVTMTGTRLGIPDQDLVLVLGGLGLFGFLALWEVLLIPRVKVRAKKQKKAKRAARAEPQTLEAEPEAVEEEEIVQEAPAPAAAHDDMDLVPTGDERQGRPVFELSMPPKSLNPGAVYSKAFITVDERVVLRVEDLVADTADLSG